MFEITIFFVINETHYSRKVENCKAEFQKNVTCTVQFYNIVYNGMIIKFIAIFFLKGIRKKFVTGNDQNISLRERVLGNSTTMHGFPMDVHKNVLSYFHSSLIEFYKDKNWTFNIEHCRVITWYYTPLAYNAFIIIRVLIQCIHHLSQIG